MVVPGWKRRATKTATGVADSTEACTSPMTLWKTPFAEAPNASRYTQIPETPDKVELTTHDLSALGKFRVLRSAKATKPCQVAPAGFCKYFGLKVGQWLVEVLLLAVAAATPTTAAATVAIVPAAAPAAAPPPAPAPAAAPPACAIALPAIMAKKIIATSFFMKPPKENQG